MEPNKQHAQRERNLFSQNFRRILTLRGKTQADVVSDLHITSSTVSDWVNGKKYPRVDKMQVLADYLGVGISDLREEKPITNLDDRLFNDPLNIRAMSLFSQLTDDQKRLVIAQIKGILEN